jgi:integrase
LGVRIGNWLSVDEAKALPSSPSDGLRHKRDKAMLAILVGCGLRRAELIALRVEDSQVREEHCLIGGLDLVRGSISALSQFPVGLNKRSTTGLRRPESIAASFFAGSTVLGKFGVTDLQPKRSGML